MASLNDTLVSALNCTTNSTALPLESTFSVSTHIIFTIIANLVFLALAIFEMKSFGSLLVHMHKHFWPSHFDYFLTPNAVPKWLKPAHVTEATMFECKAFVEVCDVGLALAEVPLIIPVFAVFLLLHYVVGTVIWFLIPFLRPTKLLYTAIGFAWPFVAFIWKAATDDMIEILVAYCYKLREAAEREGFRLFRGKARQAAIYLIARALDYVDAMDWEEGFQRVKAVTERLSAHLLHEVLPNIACLNVHHYASTAKW